MMLKKFTSVLMATLLVMSLTVMAASASETVMDEETAVATVTYVMDGTTYTDSYATLEEALENAYEDDTVKLVAQNYTMTSSATVPSKVTLIIPTAADANDTITGNNVSGAVASGTAYATLTIPENVSLTVNGTLLVAGNQQGSVPQTGCLTGNYGKMVVDGAVTLNSGANLHARGEVSGAGTITAKSGSNVYQLFQINDWRGGTATSSIYSSVFPFNLYDVNNITARTVYEYGSRMYGNYYVVYTFLGSKIETNETAMVLGAANDTGSLFRMTSSDASVVVENATDVTLYGNVSTGPLTIIFNTIFGRVNLTTENMTCPIYNMNVVVENGGSLTITDSLKFLPGASLSVSSGGELAVASGKSAYFYAVDDYSSDYYWQNRASVGDTDAALNATLGSSVSGVIASSDDTMSNITIAGISPTATGTDIVKEATQSNTSTTIVDVTFYTYTATAASAE